MGDLICDIGGTHARFLQVTDLQIEGAPLLLPTTAPTFLQACRQALAAFGLAQADALVIAAAGPVREGRIEMTNCPWILDVGALRQSKVAREFILMNDFEALALALPHFSAAELHHIGGPRMHPGAQTRAVVGAGTGLGLACLVHTGALDIPVVGEGGHVSLAAQEPREAAVIECLRDSYGHVSAERVLSGPGLRNIWGALKQLDGTAEAIPSAAQIAARAHADECERSRDAVAMFTGWLGAVAGDFALSVGATGGVFLAGGIVPRWGPHFDARLFARRFEAKGRLAPYLQGIPRWLITHPLPAARGLLAALQRWRCNPQMPHRNGQHEAADTDPA